MTLWEGALTAVANFSERAFVGNLATTNYLIKANALTNLKFIAFEAQREQAIHFAVRSDWPQLVAIINKAMSTITTEEKLAITDKWIDVESTNDLGPILRILAMVGALGLAILLVSVFWITRLKKKSRSGRKSRRICSRRSSLLRKQTSSSQALWPECPMR